MPCRFIDAFINNAICFYLQYAFIKLLNKPTSGPSTLNRKILSWQPKLKACAACGPYRRRHANPSIIEGLLEEVAKIGVASVKRIYGDLDLAEPRLMEIVLLEYSIQPDTAIPIYNG